MKVDVLKSFEKDVAKIRDKDLAAEVFSLIEKLETCTTLSAIPKLKKMKGKGNYYRIRLGDYRLGLSVEDQTLCLIRFMSRKDIYKYFP